MSALTEPRNRKPNRGELWFTRPADALPNAPILWFGYKVQHAMIASDSIIHRAMRSLNCTELQNGDRVVPASTTAIAKATAKFTHDGMPMPRRTVAHRLRAMAKKGIIQRFDVTAPTTRPTGTVWRVLHFDNVLENWKNDPEIFTPAKRQFFHSGKNREICGPARAAKWKLNGAIAEANPAATRPTAYTIEQPATAAREPELPAPAELDFGPLTDALIDVCGAAAVDDARFVWKAVLHATGKHQPPTVAEVCAMVHNIGRERRKIGGGQPTTPGFIEKKIAGRVEAWKRHRSKDAAERAKAERWQRDERVNTYAGYIRDLQRDDIPPDEREQKAELLSLADPTEVEAANRALEQTRSRTA